MLTSESFYWICGRAAGVITNWGKWAKCQTTKGKHREKIEIQINNSEHEIPVPFDKWLCSISRERENVWEDLINVCSVETMNRTEAKEKISGKLTKNQNFRCVRIKV